MSCHACKRLLFGGAITAAGLAAGSSIHAFQPGGDEDCNIQFAPAPWTNLVQVASALVGYSPQLGAADLHFGCGESNASYVFSNFGQNSIATSNIGRDHVLLAVDFSSKELDFYTRGLADVAMYATYEQSLHITYDFGLTDVGYDYIWLNGIAQYGDGSGHLTLQLEAGNYYNLRLSADAGGFAPGTDTGVFIRVQTGDFQAADLNQDGVVGTVDLLDLLSDWGSCDICGGCFADLNGDCIVDSIDLLTMLGSWG